MDPNSCFILNEFEMDFAEDSIEKDLLENNDDNKSIINVDDDAKTIIMIDDDSIMTIDSQKNNVDELSVFSFECFIDPTDDGFYKNDTTSSIDYLHGMALLALRNDTNDAIDTWTKLPAPLKIDKAIALCALKYFISLPPSIDFEMNFPNELRYDRDYVMAVVQRQDYGTLYNERRWMRVPEHLFGDKEIMLHCCCKVPGTLRDCTEDLLDDCDVVKSVVQHSGLDLQYASARLREDEEIVRIACTNHGGALEFCTRSSTTCHKLLSDRDFMLNVVVKRPEGGRLIRYSPSEMIRSDEELIREAIVHGMDTQYCPIQFRTSIEFWKTTVLYKSHVYLYLVEQNESELYRNVDIGEAAIVAKDATYEMYPIVLDKCPDVRFSKEATRTIVMNNGYADRSFMKKFLVPKGNAKRIVDSCRDNDNGNVPLTPSPTKCIFWYDKEIMKYAIQCDRELFVHFDTMLLLDPDIFNTLVVPEFAFEFLIKLVPAQFWKLFPDVAIQTIQICFQDLNLNPNKIQQYRAKGFNSWIYKQIQKYPSFEDEVQKIALDVIVAEDTKEEVVKLALDICPNLQLSRDCVLAITKRGEPTLLKYVLQKQANESNSLYFTDKEIMCNAILCDWTLYECFDGELLKDSDIQNVLVTANTAVEVIKTVPVQTLIRYPEIVIKAIEVRPVGIRLLSELIPIELWLNNRSVQVSWIRQGYPLVPKLQNLVQTDRELALEVAEHSIFQFNHVGTELRSDVDFMTEAIDRSGFALVYALDKEMTNSIPIAVRAIGNTNNPLLHHKKGILNHTKNAILSYVIERMDTHTAFVTHFLRGIDIPSSRRTHITKRCRLSMLDQGIETSQCLKKLIAEFVGVPMGNEIQTLRRAYINLTASETKAATKIVRPYAYPDGICIPDERDVCIGRGFHRPQNVRYLDLLYLHCEQFEQMSPHGKQLTRNEIIQTVYDWGGRFLQLPQKSGDGYYEASDIHILNFLNRALRDTFRRRRAVMN